MDLVAIVPTRGRPSSAARLQAVFDRSDVAKVIFVIDEDDPAREQYEWLGVRLMIAPPGGRPGIVDPLNWAVNRVLYESRPKYLAFMGDDHLPQGDWDVRVIETLRQLGTGFCYGNDLLMGERIPTAVFVTADVPRALGWMAAPALQHLFVDDYWLALGQGIDRIKYLPDTIIEHLHFLNGKADNDATYDHCNNPAAKVDNSAWQSYKQLQLKLDIQKLQKLIKD